MQNKEDDFTSYIPTEFNVNYSYPFSDDFEFHTALEKINLDKEREHDLITSNGFVVTSPRGSLKSSIKNPDGIFSTKFGQTISDLNAYCDRYKCDCGFLRSRIHHGITCPKCGTKVTYRDDNFEYFGWLVINEAYWIIHPNIYKLIDFLMGKGFNKISKLENILKPKDDKDKDGHSIENVNKPKDEPWFGDGMIGFVEHFDEIMSYYLAKKPAKKAFYDEIMKHRDDVFTHSIPVYTTLLRPADIRDGNMSFELTNRQYTMMSKLIADINKVNTKNARNKKNKNELLYDLQTKYNELYKEIEAILAGKKGQLRILIGGRYTFSSRSVIAPDPSLRIDEVKMSYYALVILLEQRIINILCKSYNITTAEAYKKWEKSKIKPDDRIKEIIMAIINSSDNGRGLPVIINRNPTIGYGSILSVYCVGFTETYTLSVPLQILPLVAGDFDGDVFNILLIINKAFEIRAMEVFNPANAMFISRNDGKMNTAVIHQRDTLIMANNMIHMGRSKYTQNDLAKIRALKEKNKKKYGY